MDPLKQAQKAGRPTVVLLGAGRTGRGFLARLLLDQTSLVFIDWDADLVGRLRSAGRYAIRFYDGSRSVIVGDYAAHTTEDPACAAILRSCAAVFVSVGGENTAAAGEWLRDRLAPGTCVVICENAPLPARLLEGDLARTAASGAVFCTTVAADGLDLLSEAYPVLYVDAKGMPETIRQLTGIRVADDFPVLMHRKIYTYNAASGIIAYLGARKGFRVYADAANDPEIAAGLTAFYREINQAVCLEYRIPIEEQQAFAELSRQKFQNRAIIDSIERNAADPARKLAPDERIIAPARLIRRHGGRAAILQRTAAAALRYMGIHSADGAADALGKICRLKSDDPLFQEIMACFLEDLRADS